MIYEAFSQIWDSIDWPDNSNNSNALVDTCSPRCRAALVAASKGDFSAFDAARAKLKRLRGEGEDNAVAPREDEKFE